MPYCVIPTPLGPFRVASDEIGITSATWADEPLTLPDTPLLQEAVRQLEEYFAGVRQSFSLPLHMQGTPFRKRCWEALCAIPYGETISYGEQARRIGSPKAVRAVGGANHHNSICIIVPCHRVIGKDGSLTGYGGGVHIKQWLLAHEAETLASMTTGKE